MKDKEKSKKKFKYIKKNKCSIKLGSERIHLNIIL